MYSCINMELMDNAQSSFGIKKIVDVKLSEDGKQMYKVQWEPTWEPVENLASCQHLIDDFWSFVNKAKTNGENAQQYAQALSMNSYMNSTAKIPKMSEDDKSDVQRLIARTNQTSPGNPLMSPNMLLEQQFMANMHQKPNQDQKPIDFNPPFQNTSMSPSQKSKGAAVVKADPNFSPSSGGKEKVSNNASLKYVENFENPYVKIILVCKICNKEQSLKFSHTWKRHYLSHASTEDKPHKCPHCPKAFITLTQKKKHLKTHENSMMQHNMQQNMQQGMQHNMQQSMQPNIHNIKEEQMSHMY